MGVYEKPRPFGCTGECERCLDVTKCRGEFSVPKAPGNVTLENVARHLYYQYTRKRGWLEDKWDDEPEVVKNLYRNMARGAIVSKKNPVVIYIDENGKQYKFTQFALVGVERVTDCDMELKTIVAITDRRSEVMKGIAQGVAVCYESTRIAYHEAVKCEGKNVLQDFLERVGAEQSRHAQREEPKRRGDGVLYGGNYHCTCGEVYHIADQAKYLACLRSHKKNDTRSTCSNPTHQHFRQGRRGTPLLDRRPLR